MTKYTIAVNAGEYLSGLYDAKEEAQSAAFDLIMNYGVLSVLNLTAKELEEEWVKRKSVNG